MERIAALVEGHTEYHFIKASYANAIVQRPFPNGEDVSISLIIESIRDALEVIGGNIKKVIIMLDREGRLSSCSAMRAEIMANLTESIGDRTLYIAVTDRHIENWILADEDLIKEKFNKGTYRYPGDGTRGKALLEKICGKESRGPKDKAMIFEAMFSYEGI